MLCFSGRQPTRRDDLIELALKNLVDDVTFIEKEVKRLEKPGLDDVFDEIKSVSDAQPNPPLLPHASLTQTFLIR